MVDYRIELCDMVTALFWFVHLPLFLSNYKKKLNSFLKCKTFIKALQSNYQIFFEL